jgi:undecaprenyl diphosphate synthase
MKPRTSRDSRLHVGIIMDGNGRWAEARGLPRIAGHRAGGDTVRRVVEDAPDLGVGTLTLYAFSADNWSRPRREVRALMGLLIEYLRREVARCVREGVKVSFIGRRDRLPDVVARAMGAAEAETAAGKTLHLRLAIDYSARDSILRVAQQLPAGAEPSRETFSRLLGELEAPGAVAPEVDLLIRTGGEQRLSDFLLWESAYAELYFTPVMWPDFAARDFEAAVREFHGRQRRFGALPKRAAS